MIFPGSHGMKAAEVDLEPKLQDLRIQTTTLYLLLHKHVTLNFQINSNFVLFMSQETCGFYFHSKNPNTKGTKHSPDSVAPAPYRPIPV